MKNVVVYHTSKGGRFNNSGYKRCKDIVEGFDADYYGINIYYTFENMTPEIHEQLENLGIEEIDLASDWSPEVQLFFNEQVITGIDGEFLKAEDLGEAIICDGVGSNIGTVESYQSDNGTLEIDGLYDRWDWKELEELEREELEIMLRDLRSEVYEEHIFEMGLNKEVYELIRDKITTDELAGVIYHKMPFHFLMNWYYIYEFKNEEEAEEKGYNHGGEINGKYYAME